MMASQGRGQRIGFGRISGLVAVVGLGLGSLPGHAWACQSRRPKPAASAGTGAVKSQQVLNPTSLVPQLPPLVPAAPPAPSPTITPTAAEAPPVPVAPAPLTPSPTAPSPAAEMATTTSNPLDPAAWQNTAAPSCACTCPIPPPTNVPVPSPPTGTPPAAPPGLQPPAAETVTTPEPSTILSALVLVGAATLWRRSHRAG